ncbi:MAG: polyprenyl synthetase family protein [Betaproteobacteria bacterium]|nr:polyprenyl synthetase family protein [Betaproteobacteria bacterium]
MQEFITATKPELTALEPLLVEYLLTPNEPTNDVLGHIFKAGGKRVRPGLFLLVSELIGYNGNHKQPIAAVCEYIHTASLLHDDVIDNSTLRRGKPTVNSIWGDETAVLAGDLIYSAACRLMVKTRSLDLIDTFAECIRFMSESELFQLELLWKSDLTQQQYERVVRGKTAILFEASCKTPGFLANLPEAACQLLGDYGNHLGFVFQFADDILDYTGDAKQIGKSVSADLRAGKITLPVLCALENERAKNETLLSGLVAEALHSGECTDATLEKIIALVHSTGGIASAIAQGKARVTAAQSALKKAAEMLPPTAQTLKTFELLLALPESLLHRSH